MNTVGIRKGIGSGVQAADFSDLSNQLEGIQGRNRMFAKINVALVIVVISLVSFSYYYFVWRYAVVDDVKITQDEKDPSKIWFDFRVLNDGFLRYGHQSSVLGDPVVAGQKKRFSYQRPVQGKTEFEVFLRSRSGPLPSWTTKTFKSAGAS